jgi:signal transduction histidine kinase
VSQQVRQEIARDLHDGFAQELTLIGYEIDSLIAMNSDADLRADLRTLRFQISSLIDRTRQELFSLNKPLEKEFEVRITTHIEECGFSFEPALAIDASVLLDNEHDDLIAILRELLTNLRKHGKATRLAIELLAINAGWQLIFAADGSEALSHQPGHFGLLGIQERCAKLNADFTQEMRDGQLFTFITKVSR